jgi:hypothetical protein
VDELNVISVKRQRLLEAHTTMYGLCFAYILEITRVRLGHIRESSQGYNKETE